MSKKLFSIGILFASLSCYGDLSAQCTIVASASDTFICAGDPVTLTSSSSCIDVLIDENFNSGGLSPYFISALEHEFTNPCEPSLDSSIYLWMGANYYFPRSLTSNNMDICGYYEISFDLRFAVDFEASPCEGPDESNEGVAFQYSINNGTSWNDIAFFRPDGSILPSNNAYCAPCVSYPYITPFTSWANYSFSIPVNAQTTASKFRWFQQASSGEPYDHWGLDNIKIFRPANAVVEWSHGPNVFNPPIVYPYSDTVFIVSLTDTVSGLIYTDTVSIDVHTVNTSLTNEGFTIIANEPNANYQWVDCITNLPIFGETNQDFTASHTGNYSVIITDSFGCSAQSNCYSINYVGSNLNTNDTEFRLYPNPVSDKLHIHTGDRIANWIKIMDSNGSIVFYAIPELSDYTVDVSVLGSGIYYIIICTDELIRAEMIEILE